MVALVCRRRGYLFQPGQAVGVAQPEAVITAPAERRLGDDQPKIGQWLWASWLVLLSSMARALVLAW